MVSSSIIAAVALAASASHVIAHGLVSEPKSRAWFCGYLTKPFETNMRYPVCNNAFTAPGIDINQAYNYMSMATHELGFQKNGPKEFVCSYNSDFFKEKKTWTDVAIDWPTNDVTEGEQWFTWDIQWGPHFDDTMDFVTYITKPDFQFVVGKELTWDDFDTSAPFCLEHYDDKNPRANPNVVADKGAVTFKVKCKLPPRKGRHVIKQEWGRLPPTNERFHSCIDVMYPGSSPAIPQVSPALPPSPPPESSTATSNGSCALKGNQCGGSYWQGTTCCEAGSTCVVKSTYYSQCV